MSVKKQFHETLSFIDAVFDKRFLNDFILKTGLHLSHGEKRVMDVQKYNTWVQEWKEKYETVRKEK
jgi:hypothetical protein